MKRHSRQIPTTKAYFFALGHTIRLSFYCQKKAIRSNKKTLNMLKKKKHKQKNLTPENKGNGEQPLSTV